MQNISEQTRYQIIAQNRNNTLLVNIIGQGLYFIRTADQIFSAPGLITGFSQEEAALIGYIVGSENQKI
jgi:hypothetical protein